MQITHEQAHNLVQRNMDQALIGNEKVILALHLDSCPECCHYANSIKEMESVLLPMMQRRWNRLPPPRPTGIVAQRKPSKFSQRINLATRIVAMGAICITLLFHIYQVRQTTDHRPSPPYANIVPVPTPTMQSTSTMLTNQNCDQILYTALENDTFENIAGQFSVSTDEILRANNITMEAPYQGMRLLIPICGPTPTGPRQTLATTFTPLLNRTTTPMGSQTQQ